MFRIASLQLVFDVLAKDNASKTFRDVGSSADKAGKQAESGIGSIARSAKGVGAAVAGLGIASFFKDAIGAASDMNETLNRSNVIFGRNAGEVRGWASDSARSFGLSKSAAVDAATGFGNMLSQLGYTGDAALEASTGVVELAADLGSFNNLETGDVLDRIGAAMRGEYDSLQLLIPNINAARVETEALAATGKTAASELTAQEKAAATLAIVQRDGAAAAGDFAETSGGLANQTKIAKAQFEDMSAQLGQQLLPAATGVMSFFNDVGIPALEATGDALGFVVDAVGGIADFFGDIPGPVQLAVGAMGAFVFLKGPVGDFFDTVALKALYARDAIGTARAGGLRGAAGGLVGLLGGPWGVAIGAATVGLGFLVSKVGESKDTVAAAEEAQRGFADAVREADGAITESVRSSAAKAVEDAGLLELADQMDIKLSRVTDAALGNAAAYGSVDAAVERYLQTALKLAGGNTEDAAFQSALAAADKFRGGLEVLVPTVEETSAKQDRLAEATAATAGAAVGAVPVVDAFKQGLEAAGEAASDAQRETNMFKTALDILTGASVTMIEVESAYQSALADATGALKDMNGTVLDGAGKLNLQSESGRATADVLLGVRDSGNQLIATMVQQGRSADEVGAAEKRLREDFIRTAGQMGITGDAANALADEILGIPDQRKTTITAPTGQAVGEVRALQNQINGLTGRQVFIDVAARTGRTVANVEYIFNKQNFASGGYTGDGGKFEPKGIVHGGEYVFTKEQTARLGKDRLEVLANGGVPGFANGGLVPIRLAMRGADAYDNALNQWAKRIGEKAVAAPSAGVAGSGAVGGAWGSLWQLVKRQIPAARINSTFRAGDPGYHGRGKAIDFGFGTGPGGAGSAGLASINRLLHDQVGGNLAELIYDGIGDDRPDLKNGRPLTYNAGTRAAHRNHVHAAVYANGTNYVPQTGYAVVHKGEAIVPASENQGAPFTTRTVNLYTPDIPAAVRALRAEEQQRAALAPAW